MDLLTNYRAKSWLKERPEKLVFFPSAICSLEEELDAYTIASLIEQICGYRNKKVVLPFSFCHKSLT